MTEIKDDANEKLTWQQLVDKINQHNKENNVTSQYGDKNRLQCVVVFKNESWPDRKKDYSLDERSYRFSSDSKRFIPRMGGNSIFASSLDGSDVGIRLDWVLNDWIIDYCYIL